MKLKEIIIDFINYDGFNYEIVINGRQIISNCWLDFKHQLMIEGYEIINIEEEYIR